jgi:hypothetical protein
MDLSEHPAHGALSFRSHGNPTTLLSVAKAAHLFLVSPSSDVIVLTPSLVQSIHASTVGKLKGFISSLELSIHSCPIEREHEGGRVLSESPILPAGSIL